MGNEGSSMLKEENVARRSGAALGVDKGSKHESRQRQAMKELSDTRKAMQSEAGRKSLLKFQREKDKDWENITDAIMAPFNKLTGNFACVDKHCEDDEEEFVAQWVPPQSSATPKKSVRAKVREMVKEANREKSRCTKEYIETDSDGAGEDDDDE